MPVVEAHRETGAEPAWAPRARAWGQRAAPFLPAAAVAAAWVLWLGGQGGYFPRDWYPVGIGLLALTAVYAAATGALLPAGRWTRLALGLLTAFVAFAFLSILWADSRGAAWEAANKLLLLLVTSWLLALLPWRRVPAAVLLGVWALGAAVACAIALAGAAGDPELGGLASVGRFGAPMGYTNAAAGIAWMGLIPALLLSYRREVPVPLQGLFLAAAAFLLQFGLIPQSRGGLLALLVVGVAFVALAPNRLSLVARMLPLAVLLALTAGSILDVQTAAEARRGVKAALEEATGRLVLTVPIALVAGVVVGLLERWLISAERRHLLARRAGLGLVGLLCAVAMVGALANASRISDSLSTRWDRLTSDSFVEREGKGTRFGTLDPQGRTDAWRVARDLFEEAPVAGVGAGGFEREYTARRESERHSRYVHNFWLRILAEAGLIGALLLVAFLVAAYLPQLVRYRGMDRGSRAVALTCMAVPAFFLAQASVDWVDEYPSLAAPAFGLLFVGLRLCGPPAVLTVLRGRPIVRRMAVGAAGAAAALALLSLLFPYLSTRYVDRAFARHRAEPQEAYRDLDRAQSTNPLALRPLVSEGTIALNVRDGEKARRAFERSIDREDNWYARLELALLAAERGRFAVAERQIARAIELNRVDDSLAAARRQIVARRRVDPVRFNQSLLEETRSTFTRPAG